MDDLEAQANSNVKGSNATTNNTATATDNKESEEASESEDAFLMRVIEQRMERTTSTSDYLLASDVVASDKGVAVSAGAGADDGIGADEKAKERAVARGAATTTALGFGLMSSPAASVTTVTMPGALHVPTASPTEGAAAAEKKKAYPPGATLGAVTTVAVLSHPTKAPTPTLSGAAVEAGTATALPRATDRTSKNAPASLPRLEGTDATSRQPSQVGAIAVLGMADADADTHTTSVAVGIGVVLGALGVLEVAANTTDGTTTGTAGSSRSLTIHANDHDHGNDDNDTAPPVAIQSYLAHARTVEDDSDNEEQARQWKKKASDLQAELDQAPRAVVVLPDTSSLLDAEGGSAKQEPVKDEASSSSNRSISSSSKKRKWVLILGAILVAIVVATAIVVAVLVGGGSDGDDTSPFPSISTTYTATTPEPARTLPPVLGPTLQRIRDRGYIICSGDPEDISREQGWSVDMCQALAAAILGDKNKTEMPTLPFRQMFPAVSNGTVDISTRMLINSYDRDSFFVPEYGSVDGGGIALSMTSFLYSPVTFAGIPEFVDCAERGDNLVGLCKDLVVCAIAGARQEQRVRAILDGSAVHGVDTLSNYGERLADGTCNVLISGNIKLFRDEKTEEADGYTGPYVISDKVYFLDPLSLGTRNNDAEFGDLANWVLQALVTADALNITQDTAHLFPTTDLFGADDPLFFQRAIAAVGNYGEMYERAWGVKLPRQIINSPYLDSDGYDDDSSKGGLFYSRPLGKIDIEPTVFGDFAPLPVPNGTLERLSEPSTFLHCGIISDRPGSGLVEWNDETLEFWGLDVDYCQALAAALFEGDTTALVLVEVTSLAEGYVALANGELDVLAGAEFTMINDIREPTTGQGFAFAGIYYYSQQQDLTLNHTSSKVTHSRLGMATREGDAQWTDFVRLIVMSTIHAEAEDITQATASEMPKLELFGPRYRQALKHAVLAVGNYAEQYERNLESYIPRSNNTRNTLNTGASPMFYVDAIF